MLPVSPRNHQGDASRGDEGRYARARGGVAHQPVAEVAVVRNAGAGLAPSRGGTLVPLAITSAALGFVAVGFGTGFGLAAIAAKNDPRGLCSPSCNSAANARNYAFAEGDASTVLFVAGGGLVVTGAALWLFAPKRAPSSAWRIAPACGHRYASLTVDGTF